MSLSHFYFCALFKRKIYCMAHRIRHYQLLCFDEHKLTFVSAAMERIDLHLLP